MEHQKTNREQILLEAIAVTGDREESHGNFDHNMSVNDQFLSAYIEARLATGHQPFDGTGRDSCIFMVFNKIARIACGNDDYDHYLDAVNYMAEAGNLVVDIPSLEVDEEPTAQETVDASIEALTAKQSNG